MARSRHARWAVCVLIIGPIAVVTAAHAGSATQVTRDQSATLIDKTVGNEQWLIVYDYATGSVRGNVVIGSEDVPRFVDCDQVGATLETLSLACFAAAPCPSFPCGDDQWAFVGNVDLPRSFFASADEDPVVPACSDWNGTWRVNLVGSTGTELGYVATVTQQGCAFQFDMPNRARGVGYLYADAASLTLTFAPGSSSECTTTGYGAVNDVAFGFAFSPSCADQPRSMGGRKQRN